MINLISLLRRPVTKIHGTGHPSQQVRQLDKILVPVDFSTSSYHTMEYAINLAKTMKSPIDLLNIIDINTLENIDNPLVFNRLLSRKEAQAKAQMASFKELMEEQGIEVSATAPVIGHIPQIIKEHILKNATETILVSQSLEIHLKSLIDIVPCPILFIPENAPCHPPQKIAVATSDFSKHYSLSYPCLKIAENASKSITIIQPENSPQIKIPDFDLSIEYLPLPSKGLNKTLSAMIDAMEIDLFCFVINKPSYWDRFFKISYSQPTLMDHIPTLLVKE